MRTRPPLRHVHVGIAIAWATLLTAAAGLFAADGWSEPKFGGFFAVAVGAFFAFVGLAVIGATTAVARWGFASSAIRTWFLVLVPPSLVAALIFLPSTLGAPNNTTSTGLTIGHLPSGVVEAGWRSFEDAHFEVYENGDGGELWIGVRLAPDFVPDGEVVSREGRRYLVETDGGRTARVALIVDGVQLEVQSDYLSRESLLEVADGLTYRRELDSYRRRADESERGSP